MFDLIGTAVLPEPIVNAAQAELRKRLQTPAVVDVGRQRARLTTGSSRSGSRTRGATSQTPRTSPSETQSAPPWLAYRTATGSARSTPTGLASWSCPEAITLASPARREELCRIVVERVVIRDRRLDSIVWTPPVRPIFEKQRECPQGDSNP